MKQQNGYIDPAITIGVVGAEYGEIAFARTLLEQIGVDFEYPLPLFDV